MNIFEKLRGCVESKTDRMQTLRRITGMLRAAGHYRWVGLYAVDRARKLVSNLVWDRPYPPQHPEFPTDKGLSGRVIATRSTVNVSDVAADPDYLPALMNTRSEIIVPILGDDERVVGTIDIESECENAFTREEEELLELYAGIIRPLWSMGRLNS